MIATQEVVRPLEKYLHAKGLKGFPDLTRRWPSRSIPVCWENPDPTSAVEANLRERVRMAVATSWEAASRVRFVGWGTCATAARGVRITIADTKKGSRTRGLGTDLDGNPGAMVLNFTMKHWTPRCGTSLECFERVAIHEFGHALGFAHEQNRPDEPDAHCRREEDGEHGTCVFCGADRTSIMSYCRADWSSDTPLSECDRRSVAALYGAP